MHDALPETVTFRFARWPDEEGSEDMQFRLVYEGPLPSAGRGNPRMHEKHEIRRQLHPQLRELVTTHPKISHRLVPMDGWPENESYTDVIGRMFSRCGFKFAPLIGADVRFLGNVSACALDILFLRRDAPGGLIKSGGDIDNRIKVLFDALRIPENCGELPVGQPPTADETPFFCLLQDDSLITQVAVTTDRLLTPLSGGHVNDVKLVIHVKALALGVDL